MVNTMAMLPSMALGFVDFLRWGRCTIFYVVACVQELPVCSRKHKMNCRKILMNKPTMLPSKAFGACCGFFFGNETSKIVPGPSDTMPDRAFRASFSSQNVTNAIPYICVNERQN